MPVDRTLLARAMENPEGLRFDDAHRLATQLGFEHVRTEGSHRIYRVVS